MNPWMRFCVATILLAVTSAASAAFHLFRIEQLYSNADGTVQFIVLVESTGSNGEHLWAGQPLTSTHAGVTKTFAFPANLPSAITAGRHVLVATQGFAALGLVTPDYVVCRTGSWRPMAASVNYAGVDTILVSVAADRRRARDRSQRRDDPEPRDQFRGAIGLRFRAQQRRWTSISTA